MNARRPICIYFSICKLIRHSTNSYTLNITKYYITINFETNISNENFSEKIQAHTLLSNDRPKTDVQPNPNQNLIPNLQNKFYAQPSDQVAHYMELQKLLDNINLSVEQTVWAQSVMNNFLKNGANIFNID